MDLLVVDDEAGIRDLLTRLAVEAGATCRVVATGEEGVELLRSGARCWVLRADYRLDGMAGIAFLEAARRLFSDATRVLFTGIDRARIAQGATLRAQVSYFLVKPVGLAELRRVRGEASQPAGTVSQSLPGRPAFAERALQAYQMQHRHGGLEEALLRVRGPRTR